MSNHGWRAQGMNSNFAKWSMSQILVIMMLMVAGTAFAAGEALLHNSQNTGSTKWGGNWGVVGGQYGEFTCATCHNKTTNNVKRVAETVNGNPVVFNNMTAFGDDTAIHTTSSRICEVCHTQTAYHRYDNTAQSGGLTHPNGDCTLCHSHADAFKPTSCTGCHGHNVGSDAPIVTGKHAAHTNNVTTLGVNYSCAACHAPTVSSDTTFSNAANHNPNNLTSAPFGAPNVNYGGTMAGTYDSGTYTCTATCHTDGKGGAPATAVAWNGVMILDCKGCHGGASSQAGEPVYVSGAAGSATANSHPKHVTATGVDASCQNCHGATMSGSVLNASGKHTDGSLDVVQGNSKTFVYTAGTKTCATASCHSNGFFTADDAQWGATLTCAGCHGDKATAAAKLTGAHNAHMNGGATTGGTLGCVDCHAPSVTNDTTLKASGGHMNNMLNFSGARAYKAGFNLAAGTCSTYCHTNGKGAAPAVAVTWSGPAIDCSGCHAMAAIATGAHQAHLAKGANCANCHNSTTNNSTTITGLTHIDGTVTLVAGGSFKTFPSVSFTQAGSGCNTITCHGGSNAPDWNAKATCDTCHPKANLSGAHQVHMGSLDLASASIFYDMTANRTPANSDSVRKYGFGCASCHPLETANHINGTVDVDLNRVGVAGVGTLRMLNHSSASYAKGGTMKCSNIYCHSNASRIEAESNVKANTSLAWTDSFSNYPNADRCAYCHGNQPSTGAHAAHSVGLHTFNNGSGSMLAGNIFNGKSGKVPITNKANTAHGNANNSTTIGCYICHNGTVTSAANDKNTRCVVCHKAGNTWGASLKGNASIANLSNHVNGNRDIIFKPVQVLSKAQVRPKGASTTSNTGFDYYSGIWTRTSYKSMSTLSYDKAKVALDTNTMWHPGAAMASSCTNIACHNGKTVNWNLANFNDPNKCMDCHNAL